MKPRLLPVVLALALAIATGAHAGMVPLGIRTGVATPTGDAHDVLGNGFFAGVSLVDLPDSRNGGGLDLTFHHFGGKTFPIVEFDPLSLTSNMDVMDALVFARIALAPKRMSVFPYLKGGFGYEHLATNVTLNAGSFGSVGGSTSESHFGVMGGLGLSIPTGSRAGLCVEGLYHQVDTGGSSPLGYVTVGLTAWKDASH